MEFRFDIALIFLCAQKGFICISILNLYWCLLVVLDANHGMAELRGDALLLSGKAAPSRGLPNGSVDLS